MSHNNGVFLKYMEKIVSNVDSLKMQMHSLGSENPIVCFRGESKDYGETKLMPSLFRINNGVYLDKELIELLCDYDIPNSLEESLLSKSIAGQHFVATSRLLDITFSILPALFFATDNFTERGYVYSFVFPESFSPNSEYINSYYDKIVNQKFIPYSKDFKVITHSYNNERIKLQSGGFLLFSGKTFNKIPEEYYNKPIIIEPKDKMIIRDELSKYFNITEATIFPEKDKRKSIIENRLSDVTMLSSGDDKEHKLIELEYYLRRIEFETMLKLRNKISTMDLKRFLRNEKSNLKKYLDKNFDIQEEREKVEKRMLQKFKLIEKRI